MPSLGIQEAFVQLWDNDDAPKLDPKTDWLYKELARLTGAKLAQEKAKGPQKRKEPASKVPQKPKKKTKGEGKTKKADDTPTVAPVPAPPLRRLRSKSRCPLSEQWYGYFETI